MLGREGLQRGFGGLPRPPSSSFPDHRALHCYERLRTLLRTLRLSVLNLLTHYEITAGVRQVAGFDRVLKATP